MEHCNFTIQDLTGTLAALCVFPLFMLFPGYVLGWLANILSFRYRLLVTKILLSIALSIAVCPVLTYLLARLFSFTHVWFVYTILWMSFLVLIAKDLKKFGSQTTRSFVRQNYLPILVALAWIVLATVSLVDLQINKRLYFSMTVYDYAKHVAVTDAITRTGVPPVNPSFFPGHSLELFYYYFWFLICSLVDRLGGSLISSRLAVYAGTVWSGFALIAIVPLYLRFSKPNNQKHLWIKALIGITLLLISGLDFLYIFGENLFRLITREGNLPSYFFELWNTQITAWLGAVLWVPHHVAGLVACLTGFLLFRSVQENSRFRDKFFIVTLSGCSFASAIGLSIWVTFVAAAFLFVWIVVSLSNKWRHEASLLVIIGLLTILLSTPYLMDLHGANHLSVTPLALTVRPFIPAEQVLKYFHQEGYVHIFTNLLLLPINYFMELGFVGVASIIYWQKRFRSGDSFDRDDMFNTTMLLVSIFICTFLKSDIKNNDLGWRGIMFAQFILLIWSINPTISLVSQVFKTKKKLDVLKKSNSSFHLHTVITFLLVIGAMTTAYDFIILRTYTILADAHVIPLSVDSFYSDSFHNSLVGSRVYNMRQMYQSLKKRLPNTAIIQHNPQVDFEFFHGLYGDRQVVASDETLGTLYGIPPSWYNPVASSMSKIFRDESDLTKVDKICEDFSIATIVVKDTDPAWINHQTWILKRRPLFANSSAKAFACGDFAEEMREMSAS